MVGRLVGYWVDFRIDFFLLLLRLSTQLLHLRMLSIYHVAYEMDFLTGYPHAPPTTTIRSDRGPT